MLKTQIEKTATLKGHQGSVYALAAFEPESGRFFSAGSDGLVILWDLRDISTAKVIARAEGSVYALLYVPEKKMLVIGQNNQGLHYIFFDGAKTSKSLKLAACPIFDLQYSDGKIFAALGNGEVNIIDIEGMRVLEKLKNSTHYARSMAFSPDGKHFAVGYSDNFIRIFSTENQSLLFEFEAHANSIFSLRYTPDSAFLASGAMDAQLKFWETEHYTLHEQIPAHLYTVNHIGYSPDGKYFATGSKDKTVKIWESESRKLLKVVDKARHGGHASSANKILWLPYENTLLSASDDRSIAVWKLNFEISTAS